MKGHYSAYYKQENITFIEVGSIIFRTLYMMPLAQISVQIWMIIDYNITTVSKAILILQLMLRMGMSV